MTAQLTDSRPVIIGLYAAVKEKIGQHNYGDFDSDFEDIVNFYYDNSSKSISFNALVEEISAEMLFQISLNS